MTDHSSVKLLKRFLTSLVDKLDRLDRPSSRAKKRHWFDIELHIPPLVWSFLTAIFLFGLLIWDMNLTLYKTSVLGGFVLILVVLVSTYLQKEMPRFIREKDVLPLVITIFFVTLVWIKGVAFFLKSTTWLLPHATPVPIAALLATLLLHRRLAIVLAVVMGILFGFVNHLSFELMLVSMTGGLVMVMTARESRTAQQVTRAGVLAGLAQALVVLGLAIMGEWSHRQTWLSLSSAFMSGLISSFFSLGALPYLESFFSRISNLRLIELADVNHPLLKKMSIEAPGTYHHSMIVANLAADAASAIGANALLCRAGANFHDIGKLVKAEYFIENQGAFGNPHDEVAPSLSKLVITSHVKEGVALAKSYKINSQVADFIPQHHGTSQIEYFYQKAKKLKEFEDEVDKEEVKEETYRYPGPRPQSREAGIVMLADSVEAASRTLEEPN